MNGGDLRFHTSRKTFTEEAVRFWMAELGCALRYIHNHGIVHRDVKPDNILLDAEGHVHLTDFVRLPSILPLPSPSTDPEERRRRPLKAACAEKQVRHAGLPRARSI